MQCSKCNLSIRPGPGTIAKERHGEITLRHRICPRRLGRKKETKYQGRAPRKLGWKKARLAALSTVCEVSGVSLLFEDESGGTHLSNLAIDHVIPERYVQDHPLGPHARINLICLSFSEHAKKRAAEDQLLKAGDMLGYLQELTRLGWPMDRVHRALQFYGIKHSAGTCVYCDTMEAKLQDQKEPPTQHTGETTDGNAPGRDTE